MVPSIGGLPHCKRCGYELEDGQDTCPRCQFSPKAKGLRVSLVFLLAVVVMMTGVMVLPAFGLLFVRLAAIAFLLSVLVLTISFVATPYRLGSLFLWP